jgi:hypothetical protein
VFATGGVFTDGVGSDLVYYGATLSAGAGAAPMGPVQLARLPAGSDQLVEIALAGNRAVMKRYTEVALEPGASKQRGWPESDEPWEATWYDEAWQSVRGVGHREDIAVGDTALRVATNGADGELAIASLDGSDPIAVDHGCRFAEAFFLPGDRDLIYSCRGAAYRFTIGTGARTTVGDGMKGAYPLECGDARCRDWIGGPGPSIVPTTGGASLPRPETGIVGTAHGDVHGRLSPDGRFAIAPTDSGAISLVEVGHLEHRIVLDPAARGFTWLAGASFVFVTTTEVNAHYEDAASTVTWRDPSITGAGGERAVTRNAFSPYARAEEAALYAISKSPDRPQGLYRYPLPKVH